MSQEGVPDTDEGLASPDGDGELAADATADTNGESALPPLSDPAFVEAAFERMALEDPEHAARLEAEWGGSGGAHENLQYAAAAYEALQSPELDDLLAGLGDSPALVEVAAKIGRRISDGRKTSGEGAEAAPARDGSPHDAELDRLTGAIWDARDRGDLRNVERLSRQRDRLSGRAYGGAPVVGNGFRQV